MAAGQLYATITAAVGPAAAEQMAAAALAEARALGDEQAEAKILWNQLNLYRFTQRLPQARDRTYQSSTTAAFLQRDRVGDRTRT